MLEYGFRLEGIIGYIGSTTYSPNGMQVKNFYRMYNLSSNDHFYTLNYDEVQTAEKLGYVREPDMGYIFN